MPFVPNTPESLSALLSHTDSENPSTTCCGVSNNGNKCRRKRMPSGSGQPASGVIAVFNDQEVFYCEQHKDQSQDVALRHTASFARGRESRGRGSMDTLIEKIELLAAGGKPGEATTTTVTSRTKRVGPGDDPFIFPPKSAGLPRPPTSHQREERRQQQQKTEKKQTFWSKLCCCISEEPKEDLYPRLKMEEAELRASAAGIVENDSTEKRGKTHRRGKSDTHLDFESTPPTPPLPMMYPDLTALINRGQRDTSATATSRPATAGRGVTPATPNDPSKNDFGGRRNKRTGNPLIPPTLAGETAQCLEQELAKPFSDRDEPGYIYMFWLSDSPISPQPTPASTPNSTPKKSGGHSRQGNASDALRKVVKDSESAPQGQRILLKIGRTNNVQRRLHQWSTQCGYNLSLIRFYPHISASSPGSATPKATTEALNKQVGKKVPNSHRIERLIHIELGDNPENRPEIKCDVCKKTHKEWFSVPATRAGLQGVDEVVKKWIEYGEKSAMVTGGGASMAQAPRIPKVTPSKSAASPPRKEETPKSATKRPTLQSAPAGAGARAAAKKSPSPPGKASGSAGNTRTDNSSGNSTKTTPTRNAKTPSPGKSARPRTPSRPPSSRGKASSSTPKTTPPPSPGVGSSERKKRPSGGGGRWKLYDENEGCEEYQPDDEVE
ncbi:unnamed protein product [Tuber melanosporum]|uniref:(Perigord truffle) hypothetical protein n=1 Tax=Tuber melanosporum (strain Mel28) TaxID=656061 RepID=D5GEF6_TUBMM|nr:uncharacterized protein GSTUM_00006459001 [Tuber melanosporum]CAZ82899.1 unnamed protein product [Tuber melanosporum]